KGIAEGIDNSNFLLETTKAPYILTSYEKRIHPGDLPFFLELLKFMSERGVPCPLPIAADNGEMILSLKGRPAAMVTFLQGKAVKRIHAIHCSEVGRHLAHMHNAAREFPLSKPNTL